MFNSKKEKLFTTSATKPNQFIKAALKESVKTNSLGNGALKYTTTNSDFVDQFANATNYRNPRSYQEIEKDMSLLWSQNELNTVSLTFYLRMITRTVQLPDGTKTSTTQRGQGLKHEGIFRMMWFAINKPDIFWSNINLFISIASWKDIIVLLSYDLQYHGWENRVLDWNKFGQLLLSGLENPNVSELVKKYLPAIKSNSKCKTLESQADNIIAKWICSLLFGGKTTEDNYKNYSKYRKLKSSGTAHQWQQLISQGKLLSIDFNTVHGRALAQLVSGKFLANNKLEEVYQTWIVSKPIAKYTGYVYELLQPVKTGYRNSILKPYQVDTINKQFYGIIENAKTGMNPNDSGLLVVVDSSSSMVDEVAGTKATSYDIAKSMALYFSYLLKGVFSDTYMEFNDKAGLIKWKGKTPVEKLQNDSCQAYGNTNFQSVAKTFSDLLSQGVPESDFPTGILCVTDGCFNSVGDNKTNFSTLKTNLLNAGFSKIYVDNFKVVLWDIPNGYYGGTPQTAFEDFADAPNLFHISGLDGSAIAFLTGVNGKTTTPKNSQELFEAAMDQEILKLITI